MNSSKNDAQELIEKIYKFKREKCEDLSLMETMIEYSYKFDLPLQEMGNILSEHKEFVKILEKQLIKDKYIQSEEEEYESEIDDDEW
jgi:hypothetical protein